MSLGAHLFYAMVAAGGDAVVIHTGDLPYVATALAESAIGTDPLTVSDVDALLAELLPAVSLQTFNRLGAIRYECPPLPDYPGQRFTVVAYREAVELWVELRRDGSRAPQLSGDLVDTVDAVETGAARPDVPGPPSPASAMAEAGGESDSLTLPGFGELWLKQGRAQTVQSIDWHDAYTTGNSTTDDPSEPPAASAHVAQDSSVARRASPGGLAARGSSVGDTSALDVEALPDTQSISGLSSSFEPAAPPQLPVTPRPEEGPSNQPALADPNVTDGSKSTDLETFELDKFDRGLPSGPADAQRHTPSPAGERPIVTQTAPAPAGGFEPAVRAVPPRQAVVLPMSRTVRNGSLEPLADRTSSGLVHLLRTVAARGGSALYISSDARPLMRIDGEMQPLEEVDPLSAVDVETLLIGVMPERTHEALRTGERTEWISEVPDVGRVRCVSFWDHRGAGGIFRILTARVVTAEQLGLTREVQALALQPDGLVLIAGPRSSGKSTLISAFVDLINRTRRHHVITIENEIQVIHESRGSMISQREVRDDGQELLAAIGVALREDPDVLAIEELRGEGTMRIALEAAGSGRLVIGGLPAHSAADAVDRIFDRFGQDQQLHAQLTVAENLRGIVVQTLLRKPGGGRVAAREVLLNTPAVASLIADGRTSQLSVAIEAGRQAGMISLNESLVALVKSGAADAGEAYRRAGDREGLLALLKRHGVDTSRIEHLA